MKDFKGRMRDSFRTKESRIVLALDLWASTPSALISLGMKILKEAEESICALKLNRQMVLPLGLKRVGEVVELAHSYDLPVIMDCKINDVGHTNHAIAEHYFSAGFDAVTANPFVGWSGGLDSVFESAKRYNAGVILLVHMSHPGSLEGYGQTVIDSEDGKTIPQYLVFARKALSWNADGIVVGATFSERIREISDITRGRIPIYSPGVGVQGGRAAEAIASGSDYLIVGRTIYRSKDPKQAAEELKRIMNGILEID